jgi:hypothetical protein
MEINFKLELILLILILIAIIYGFTFYSCCRCGNSKSKSKEGYSDLSDYNIQKRPINTSSWFTPNLTYNGSKPTSKGIQAIENRPPQPIPLPKNEMLMFANTPFGPEYCPNTFSNSMGCAAMTTKQYGYLVERGGNNVPYSEY